MKRDLQLIRKILLEIEDKSDGHSIVSLPETRKEYTNDQIQYHLKLLSDAGYIEAKDASASNDLVIFPITLTWEGHEFIDEARDEKIWNKVLSEAGKLTESIALPVLRELLTAAIRGLLFPH
jgi:hypothetical protein